MKILEGTWRINTKYKDEAIQRIEELKKWLYDKFGDDAVFDGLDSAIDEIESLCKEDTKYWNGFANAASTNQEE